jgi:hypothetical protein
VDAAELGRKERSLCKNTAERTGRDRLLGGERRIQTAGAMRVSSLPKAARSSLCLCAQDCYQISGDDCRFLFGLSLDGCGARLKCLSSGRATSSVLPDSKNSTQTVAI